MFLALVLIYYAYRLMTESVFMPFSYCVEASFQQLPPDDHDLERWLTVQPGVMVDTVIVRRLDKPATTLEVGFMQSRSLAGEPPLPDLGMKCRELGYKGSDVFHDCANRYR